MKFAKKINQIKKKGLYRKFRTITSSCSDTIKFKQKDFIMLASNNYFGLNTNKKVVEAAKKALEKYGTGNVASRLIINLDLHEKLEKEIARYKKQQAALVYATGYVTNLGIISSVAGKGDVIISDELNHASIIDGCNLSKASVLIYKHCDVKDLELKLKFSKGKNILVITDSVFSMDGNIAPLNAIINLKKKYPFTLMIDDAHATGIINTNLKGIDIHMGTLSKAMGSQGGYVAGSKELIDYLRNTSRPFIFSTGLSAANVASALEALKIIKKDKSLKNKLLKNAAYLRNRLSKLGFKVKGKLQIIPLILDDNKKIIRFQKLLEKEVIFVTAIRPPTVKTARLRISVMATHRRKQLDKAIDSFRKAGIKLNLIPHARK